MLAALNGYHHVGWLNVQGGTAPHAGITGGTTGMTTMMHAYIIDHRKIKLEDKVMTFKSN